MLDHDLENSAEITAKSWVEWITILVLSRLNVKESEESSNKLVVLFTCILFFFFYDLDWELFFLVVFDFFEFIFLSGVGSDGNGVAGSTFS